MDHRYNPSFAAHIEAEGKWAVRHRGCVEVELTTRGASSTCRCGVTVVCRMPCVSVELAGSLISIEREPIGRRKYRHAYVCACGERRKCSCKVEPINYAAQLLDAMTERGLGSVADVDDKLVPDMRDDEVVAYGTLRDAFLRSEHIRHRSVERIRQAAADERTSRGGEVVYFVASDDGKLKIGTSANVEKRMTALQTSSAAKLTLTLTIPGSTEVEAELHKRFAHLREGGEWFTYTPELRSFVEGAAFYKTQQTATPPAPSAETTPRPRAR